MADVAAAAGVSEATVSRALSGRGDLPAETRVRVQQVANHLGYVRGASQRGRPVTTDPRLIELVLGTFDDGWANEVTAGAREGAARLGYDLVLTAERDDPEDDWPMRVAVRRSAGVVLGLIRPTPSQLNRLRGLNIPLVLLDPASDPHGELESIGTTDWQGGYDVGVHLAGLGLRRFVLVVGEPRLRFGRAREEGFRDAIQKLVPGASLSVARGDWQDGDLTRQLAPLLKGAMPVGVFAGNDAMAVGVYRAAQHLGLVIPDDLSVAGFDDVTRAAALRPPLTTVRQPIREMAIRAVEMIQQRRDGIPPAMERVEIPSRLIVRASTARRPDSWRGEPGGRRHFCARNLT